MMKKMAAVFFLAIVICAATSFNRLPIVAVPSIVTGPPPAPDQRAVLRTIILDAGHGGIDPGASGLISHEADIALDITLKLGKAIQSRFPGLKVVYTRTSDVLPGNLDDIHRALRLRADMANKAKGDLFISIHCDATDAPAGGYYAKRVIGHKKKTVYVGRKKRKKIINAPIYESYWVKNMVTGTHTFIWAADRTGSKSSIINEGNGKEEEGGGENEGAEKIADSTNILDLTSPEAKIRAQLYEKKYFANSFSLASLVEDEFQKAGRQGVWGVMQRNYKGIWVLQATAMPSILIETGFVTNKEEEEYLNSDQGQNEIVENIVSALKRYQEMLAGGSGQDSPAKDSSAMPARGQ
ncbi:MAG: N-acetylmuramoyl-L-alanine amidase [Puia sp.]|nr:N-acetylmuramoyl-L-alanine amidase [Puia sp.]